MRLGRIFVAGLGLVIACPAHAGDAPDPRQQAIDKAGELAAQHKAAEVLTILQPVIADLEKTVADDRSKGNLVFCASSTTEAIFYGGLAAQQKKSGIVLGSQICEALFLKAFALTDLQQGGEAIATLEELTALAPYQAHYFVELGFAYRVNGQTEKARAAYQHAIDFSALAGTGGGYRDRAAALRGIGYILTDQHDLDGAQKAYGESLKYDPDSTIAKSELKFIENARRK